MSKRDVAILDIGSYSLTVMVGERGINNTFKIKGKGSVEYAGFSNGEFLEPEQMSKALALAINNAQVEANTNISEMYVGVPGEFTNVSVRDVCINFNKKKKIGDSEVEKLFNTGNIYKNHPTHTVINQSPVYFVLDDNRRIIEPRGQYSTKLQGLVSYCLAENNFLDFICSILDDVGVRSIGFISSNLAEMLHLFAPEVRDRYVFLVDCGYITTNVMLGRGDALLFLNSFSLGGGYITGDLSQCLKMNFAQAESLKRKVDLGWDAEPTDTYDIAGKEFITPYSAKITNEIVCDRIDMICEYISKCISKCEFDFPDYIPMFLTGGGVNMVKGIRDYMSRKIGRKVELIAPQLPTLSRPDYSSEIGLLDLAIDIEQNDSFLLVR